MKRIFSTAVFVTGACLLIGFGYHIMTDSNIISRDYVDVPMSAVASWPEGVAPSSGMQDLGDGSVRVRRNANGELFNPSLNSVVGRDRTTFFFVTQESGKFAIEGLAGANINPADPDLHLKTSDLGITASEEELFMKTMKAELQVMSAEDAPPEEAAVSAGAMAGARVGAMPGARVGAMSGARAGAMSGARVGAMSGTRVGAMSGARVGAMAGARVGAMSGARAGAMSGTISGGGFLKVKN